MSVEAIKQTLGTGELMTVDIDKPHNLEPLVAYQQQQKRWLYVLSDNLTINAPLPYCISMRKPDAGKLVSWLKKIIKCGQANCIMVQDLCLDEADYRVMKMLCLLYKVTLINVRQSGQTNLVYGPW